ncbi:Ferric siderophore transport system, periplasmic binding protein TonB [Acidisarcina polymorpha]|uniref:Ferric siderophore transport system, periplasmic binding protein TonB n=1 Tax=Acidisarcina polymorpha TaxID=2211140 RepID=A0A2Z5FX78_9BACT|nr:TonB family protein [Acidisarcina polymorpha]AXC11451.1 Ferric siderophore transport system, periplasmic binding protein TonB [Acidisarcina polymorpha]
MPTTEVPPSPPSPSTPPPDLPFRRRRARYEELEPEELFHVIDDLEGSKNRGRIREFIWISIIAHMLVFWYLAYGPRYFQHVRVVNPSDILKQREKEITSVELSDALKHLKSKDLKSAPEPKKPTIDRKTLDQLRAQRKLEQAPAPQRQPPPPPQVAQEQPKIQPPQPQPLPPDQQSQLESPKPTPAPAPTTPSFNTGPSTPGEAIRQAARAAASGPPVFGGDSGASAPNAQPGSAGGAEILSDTMGVDFGPYMKRIIYDTERAWWPIIPEVARPPLNKQGRVLVRFKIMKDGSVKEMQLEGPSGDVSLDRAAWGGILGAAPFPQLPKDFKGPYLELRFYFLYNIKPGKE